MSTHSGLHYRGRTFGSVASCACHSRRGFLAGATAAAAAALLPAPGRADVAAPAVRTIDVHHHFFPPRYRIEAVERLASDVGSQLAELSLKWSPAGAIEKMDQAGVATAINSISTPGVWFDDGEAGRPRARECNEFGAQLMRDYPGRFGMFAAIPLPDTDGSLKEIEYALDVLKLDGIGLLTSYAGKLLGDPAFSKVFEELNRRKAVVFVHPTMSCCGNPIPGVGSTAIEFPMDTTRAITSLLFSGAFARYSSIRFIFSHGGGMLLPVFNRLVSAAARLGPDIRMERMPNGVEFEVARQYYDLASIGSNAAAIAGLRQLLPNSQLLYGSDEPFNSSVKTAAAIKALGFPAGELQAIQRDNAVRLLPRLHA